MLVAARKGSPLLIGVGEKEDEYFIASDATPFVEYTNKVVYLNDYEIAVIRDNKLTIKNVKNIPTIPSIQVLDIELEAIEKGGCEHFMLKEILEQPKSIRDSMRGRINSQNDHLMLGGLRKYIDQLVKVLHLESLDNNPSFSFV
jgi:glucosamine--fructose-6-phosphate aminotransferase (isomerizing)